MKINPGLALLSITALMSSGPLLAQDSSDLHPWLEDDFIVSLGGFFQQEQFKVSVNGLVPGEDADLNNATDVSKDQTTFSLWLRWNFGEKWSVTGQYWSTGNDSSRILDEDVNWGNSVIKAGSNAGVGSDLDLVRVFFGRTLFTDADYHEFGLGAGLHWLQIGAYIEGEVFVDGASSGFRRESVSADLPLPNIGAWYWRSLSPRWLITTHVDWFSATVGDYSGALWNIGAGVRFQAWDHVGLGLAYQYFEIDGDVDTSGWYGDLQLTQDGPFLSLDFNW